MTTEMILFLAVLGVTVFLFVSEWLRVDVVAILAMVAVAWLGLVSPQEALSGLSSNAVVSVIGVMILGHGIDRTGVTQRITAPVIRLAGGSERRLLTLVSLTAGLMSAFMQNIGAAALFLPAILRIARQLELSAARLLMPMGFAAILGGTLTMVASGPLILLNDLLRQRGETEYNLFAVTPIGLALLATGIGYFLLLGNVVLPRRRGQDAAQDPQRALIESWGLPEQVSCFCVPAGSSLIGRNIEEAELWPRYNVNLLVLEESGERQYAPWRRTQLRPGQELALLGAPEDVERLAAATGLQRCEQPGQLHEELQRHIVGGFAELIIPPRAPAAGKTLREIGLRKNMGVEPVLLLSGDRPAQRDFSDQPLMPGDTLVVHGLWERIRAIGEDPSFLLMTPVTREPPQPREGLLAVLCFLGAIGLAISGAPLSISLLSGALALILLRVVTIDEAYQAVDWRTVFLLAGLIPLGLAMQTTGTAEWMARGASRVLTGAPAPAVLAAVGLLATLFSLFMSNVAATVLLVPLVALLGEGTGISPRVLGLLVAVCASNSFVLPTHQVNALLMSPGGYRNRDYLRAGSVMTLLFLVVAVALMWALYLP